ncbi:hypothetical protein EB118_12980 [bacterium]|nr:hypothetical protein [Actinomycetota bacterium]NDG30971.1 hypothetical protein [bacterium]
MFDPICVIFGFVVGMLVSSVFVPPTSTRKFYPDIKNPNMILKNPGSENGCFRLKPYQVSCTENITQLNK